MIYHLLLVLILCPSANCVVDLINKRKEKRKKEKGCLGESELGSFVIIYGMVRIVELLSVPISSPWYL